MYISNIDNPFKASMKMMEMTDENSQPGRITQDVLILSARNDHFVPIKLHKMMIKSLKNAKSVKGIIYTKETSANNHCQIGNIPLVSKDILDWMRKNLHKNNYIPPLFFVALLLADYDVDNKKRREIILESYL
jgi:poly(3-hydroxyalkanoate) synthetase